MDWDALQAELDAIAQRREATAILVDGKRNIRRSGLKRSPHDPDSYTAEVWDDEYATTLIFVDGVPRPELVCGIFLDRKRHYCQQA